MTSVRPIINNTGRHSASDKVSKPKPLVRFYSATTGPDEFSTSQKHHITSAPVSPRSFQGQDTLFEFTEPKDQPSFTDEDLHPPSTLSSARSVTSSDPLIKISEYRTPEETPFEPLTQDTSEKTPNRYLFLAPRTIFSMSLLSIVSLAIVLIGFGVAYSNRKSTLDYRCPLLSYCPQNTSYIVLCNLTTEYCNCYDTEDKLLGCYKQRRYGYGCYRSQECANNYNLQCNMSLYQCQCLDHYYYNGSTCIPLLTYGESCSTLNDKCDHLLNLTCLTGNICTCDTSITFWNGKYCETYRSLGSPCDPYRTPSGCVASFYCENTTASCQCPTSAYFTGRVCMPYSSYLEPCYDASSCLPGTDLLCLYGFCQCNDQFYYWSPSSSKCTYPKHVTYNASCYDETTCESDFGLRCINGRCVCEINSYWAAGNYCDFQSLYAEQCATAPCLSYTGLICSTNTSTCTCPSYYYWDNFVCQYQRTYTGFCVYDSWCRMDLGLRCRNFTCTCSLCSTCFWDGVRCRDCPTSWQVVVSNGTIKPRIYCYVKVDYYLNWNESLANCSGSATSYFGPKSHLIYIDDLQELQDVSTFATTVYYDVFIGHTNSYNYSQWFLSNGTKSPAFTLCSGVSSTFSTLTCTRLLIGGICVTDISCYGWTSRYICELD